LQGASRSSFLGLGKTRRQDDPRDKTAFGRGRKEGEWIKSKEGEETRFTD
jgi:hypothetical protein